MGSRIVDFTDGFSSATQPDTSAPSAFTSGTLESIAASGTITLLSGALQRLRVQGDSAAVTASTTPFGGTPPNDATMIRVEGRDNTNTVTITHNDIQYGCILNGNATLGQYDAIELVYDSDAERYIEQNRNF